MFPKPQRKENRKLLDEIKKMPCIVCRSQKDIDPSHIKTRGSGGPDASFNCLPKCRRHHVEWGQIGAFKFFEKYPSFAIQLSILGWEINWQERKLSHPKIKE